jgi:glycosyltransferase involved in cell wall biosynthesis
VRIGIIPGLDPAEGGIYQYSLTMLKALCCCKDAFAEDEFITFSSNLESSLMQSLTSEGWSVLPLLPSTLKRRVIKLSENFVGQSPRRAVLNLRSRLSTRAKNAVDLDKVRYNAELEQWFRTNKIDLMIYPISTSLSFETRIPYILTIHDLQHRLQPEFPEVSANGEWEAREYLFRNGIRNATLLLAESETGKEDILTFYGEYGVTPDRVKVLPLLPSITLQRDINTAERQRVRQKYSLPDRYFFYPAQFWPHKNHLRIVKAMALIKERYDIPVNILFSGYHSGEIREATFKEVTDTASKLQVQNQISYLGYVPNEDIAALYAGARALIMPTFFGATNIPPLEAWALSCPVLTSDIRGIRQQAGEASLLVDPRSEEEIAQGMYRLWTDDELCKTLVARGARRVELFTFDDFRKRLTEIIEEAKSVVSGVSPYPNLPSN